MMDVTKTRRERELGDRLVSAEAERDALARRIDRVRTMCADAQVRGGLLRPDAVLATLLEGVPVAAWPKEDQS